MQKKVVIIGGGIVGLTTAWYLQEAGVDVTLIEKNDFSDSTSHGNAGMIVPSHFIPMASPGVISQGIKWMFSSKSPFYVKPRLNTDLIQWLWQFYRSCNTTNVQRSMPFIYEFNEWSKELYADFSKSSDFDFCFERKGLLMLYKTAHQEQEEVEMAEKAHSLGIEAQVLTASQLSSVEPNIKLDVRGGVYFPGDAHLYPNKFIKQLYTILMKKGVTFKTKLEVLDVAIKDGGISSLTLSDGQAIDTQEVIVCGGSWSPYLLKKMGVKILLQDGKGYSFTLPAPKLRPQIPTILTESKVAITPMGQDLRIGGTLELGGLSSQIHRNRLAGIVESIPKYYPDMQVSTPELKTVWMGYRPCTPDGLPYIGRSEKLNNVIVGTGHGMMGMSMGPATGKLLSQIATGAKPELDLSLCKVDRYSK